MSDCKPEMLPQVNIQPGQQLTINVYGIGSISIEVVSNGGCFITGPLLLPGRNVFEFHKVPYGILESRDTKRREAQQEVVNQNT